jgi:U4/U6 small nuclear ribonucleoprotein PRP31
MDYCRVVMRIGNEMDMTAVDLVDLLPSAAVMVVSVTGSTTSGTQLPEDEFQSVLQVGERERRGRVLQVSERERRGESAAGER